MGYGTPIPPSVYTLTIQNGNDFPSHTIDFGGIAAFIQMYNKGGADVSVRLNNLTTYFTLASGHVQIFNYTDCHITSIAFRHTNISGGDSDVDIEVLAGVVPA